jgi:mono/diheme cytochrome c family protein
MKRTTAYASIAALLVAGMSACRSEEPPMREWTPADHGQPSMPDSDREPSAPSDPNEDTSARAARALWTATCAGCHGRDGRGHGDAKPPGAQIPDFTTTTWQSSRSDAQLTQVITQGRGMMPGFGKQVNEQGIAVLVQHVRRFAAAPADANAPAGVAPAGEGQTAPTQP